MYRVRGHLIADIDPLPLRARTHPELDPNFWGLTIWDLDREFLTGGLAGSPCMRSATSSASCATRTPAPSAWSTCTSRSPRRRPGSSSTSRACHPPTPADQRRILERLIAAEAFERFLHTQYLGHKRFGLEGAESLIPMLDALLDAADDAGWPTS